MNNRTLLLLFALIVFNGALSAQTEEEEQLQRRYIMLQVGTFAPSEGTGSTLFGAGYVITQGKYFYGAELQYLAPKVPIKGISDNDITWLNLSVFGGLSLIPGGKVNPYIGGGMNAGFVGVDDTKLNAHGYTLSGSARAIGVLVLGGIAIEASPRFRLFAEARYDMAGFFITGAWEETVSLTGIHLLAGFQVGLP
jgi:opacity protein-like surface antigen